MTTVQLPGSSYAIVPDLFHASDTPNIPVIDLGLLRDQDKPTRSIAVQDIGNACQNMGCFRVINHGIKIPVIAGALQVASDFFELSAEEKKQYASKDVSKPVRYDTDEQTSNKPRSFLKHYAHPLSEWIGIWPSNPPSYREKVGEYAAEVRKVALQLMGAILESLGLGEVYLKKELEDGIEVMTVNYYEQNPDQLKSLLGLAPHSDFGCITILVQSCQGLQILDRRTESWSSVPEAPETLYVHIGDFLEVLSNGRYKGLMHRGILDARKRASIASIHGLPMDKMVITPKKLVDEHHPKGYRDSSFRDFLNYISTNDVTNGRSFIDSLRLSGA